MIKEYQLRKSQNSFEVSLYYKGVKVKVSFTGGNTYKGIQPKLRTSNLFTMKAIEASQLFEDKEVVLVRTINQEGDNKPPTTVQKRKAVISPVKAAKPTQQAAKPAQEPAVETLEPPKEEEQPQNDGDSKKEFANLGEAIMFIATNYGKQVTTESEARKFLKEQGFLPVIKKG